AAQADQVFPQDCASATAWMPPLTSTRVQKPDPAHLDPYYAGLLDYVCSGDYMRDFTNVVDKARAQIARRVMQPIGGEKLAIVLDIDETSLSSLPQILAGSFRVPNSGGDDSCDDLSKGCGYNTWERAARSPVLAPTLKLFREARAFGVDVFF